MDYVCFIVPPHIEERARARHRGIPSTSTQEVCEELRRQRAAAPMFKALPLSQPEKDTQDVYTSKRTYNLPGWLVARNEEETNKVGVCACVNKCWKNTDAILKFYNEIVGFDLAKDLYGQVISSLDVGVNFNNAFFSGQQMAYGEGDGYSFKDFCFDETVVCHELGHGVVNGTVPLVYEYESGALNESYADVFAICYLHYTLGKSFKELSKDDWMIGEKCVVGDGALRSFTKTPSRSPRHPLGPDYEPRHFRHAYIGKEDNGGVHINSSIINHAFYKVCKQLSDYDEGKSWKAPLRLWFTLLKDAKIHSRCTFNEFTKAIIETSKAMYGDDISKKVVSAFEEVGLPHQNREIKKKKLKKVKRAKQINIDKHEHTILIEQ